MPHRVIDHSVPVLDRVAPDRLIGSVYDAVQSSGLFAQQGVAGIKVGLRP